MIMYDYNDREKFLYFLLQKCKAETEPYPPPLLTKAAVDVSSTYNNLNGYTSIDDIVYIYYNHPQHR